MPTLNAAPDAPLAILRRCGCARERSGRDARLRAACRGGREFHVSNLAKGLKRDLQRTPLQGVLPAWRPLVGVSREYEGDGTPSYSLQSYLGAWASASA